MTPAPRKLATRVYRRFAVRPPLGFVRFGSLRRTRPISRNWGWDRGQPVDRHYIERFLGEARDRGDVRGRVLDFYDDDCARRFGRDDITIDVMNVTADVPGTTIVADLQSADHVPSESFDCIICLQVLNLIYDVRAAVQTLHRMLRTDGVLLVTVPALSKIVRDEGWEDHWRFTSQSAARLFREVFGDAVEVQAYGNVLAAIASLEGLSAHELKKEALDAFDPDFEVLIGVRAVKAG
jgi:SAM-dependent methyltransferase